MLHSHSIPSKNNLKIEKDITLNTTDNKKILIDHYFSNKNNAALIICPSLENDKNTDLSKNMCIGFSKFINVIIMSYRDHNKESGSFKFSGKELADLKTVINYARTKYFQVFVLGFSFGAALSLMQVTNQRHLLENEQIKGVIVVDTSDSDSLQYNFEAREEIVPCFKKIIISKAFYRKSCDSNIWLEKIIAMNVKYDTYSSPALFITNNIAVNNGIYFDNDYLAENVYLKSANKFIKVCQNWFNKIITQNKSIDDLKV